MGDQDFRAMRNFSNKIWNASRFVLEHLDLSQEGEEKTNIEFDEKLEKVVAIITKNLNKFQIGLAAETIYNEFWHWFCDEQIETAKTGKLAGEKLVYGLKTFITLLHPFVPFVTEAVWQEMYQKKVVETPLLITTSWPNKNLSQ